MRTIEGVILIEGIPDKVIWALSSSKRLSCKSFRRLLAFDSQVLDKWKGLWEMSVSIKVKCFVWLFLKDRIALMGRLLQLGVIQEERNVCPICGDDKDESRRLFVQCVWVYRMWAKVVQLWGMNFVGARDIATTCDIWFHAISSGPKRLIWRVAFLAMLWAICKMRNRVVFWHRSHSRRHISF